MHRRVIALALAWLATRSVVVWLLLGPHGWVTGDVGYFAASLADVSERSLAQTLVEYPLPGLVVIALPWLLVEAAGRSGAYGETVLVLSALVDAGFTVLLGRHVGWARPTPVVVWVLAVPLLGATAYARFDLVPGVLAGAGLLLLAGRPVVAAASAALATGFKFWPALLLPALAAPVASRRRVVTVVAGLGAALVAASVSVAGWARLVSPLTWQAERGLQIESVAATPAMVGWAVSPERYDVAFGSHNAFEVTGPGTGAMLAASEIASLLLVPVLLVAWWAAFRAGSVITLETVAWLSLAAVGLFMVTSKVLSPQYLLWLLPLAAAATAVAASGTLRLWSSLLLADTALTQAVFPVLYGELIRPGVHVGAAVTVLVLRNVLLVALVAWAGVRAGRALSEAVRSSATRPDLPGTTRASSGAQPTTRT